METQKKNYVLPIAMMFALFAMISFVTGLQNPMGIIVKNQFGASNFMSQLGNAANFIAYAFMGLPAGLMLQRIGYKKTALAAVAVGFIGVGISYLSGLMSSFSVYLIGAFVSGFSMCMLNTVVNPMLNTLGGGGNRGNQLVQFGGSLNSPMPGCAHRTVELCRKAGVRFDAIDHCTVLARTIPEDIRSDELTHVASVFAVSARMAALESLQGTLMRA